ncbi:MAG: 50S ribosomal protein L15 [Candidatus Taylorbacteria bacterium]|nr:50S ribosomal protein L15 [Candidatus Taylorbacteria bacterium]
MQSNTLKRIHKLRKPAPVGRGSKRGKTSGRGTKGQKARAGRKLRPEIRDVIMRLPKLRGRGTNAFVSRFGRPAEVKLGILNAHFEAGETVNKEVLLKKGLVGTVDAKSGIKILGTGKLDKALKVEGCGTTKSAKAAIEKAGGTVQ